MYARAVAVLVLYLVEVGAAAAQTGDAYCGAQSTADTCVIVGTFTIPDDSLLTFSLPNVDVRGTLAVQFAGVCALEPGGPCTSDADCGASGPCQRTGRITLQAVAALTLGSRARILARGEPGTGDVLGPDGGTITLVARDVTLAGSLLASAEGTTTVAAGRGGRIVITADGSVTLASSARLDASSARGGCGGSIVLGGGDDPPTSIVADGLLDVDAATFGGTIDVVAREYVSAPGTFYASNIDGDLQDRAGRPCLPGDLKGGGRITLRAGLVEFTGAAKARGKEAGGGVVRFTGERGVTVDSSVGTSPISVLGGDANATTTGGGVFLSASAGDVIVRHGAIEADGAGLGFGSDAGAFELTALGTTACTQSQAHCGIDADCGPDDRCVEAGGNIVVAAPLSAAGGAGFGFGCLACKVDGSGSVTVTSPVDVGGGKRSVGGEISIAAGRDLTLGPGPLNADGGHGGDVFLAAGVRAGTVRDVSGVLDIVNGTDVRATAFLDAGVGGHIAMEGCDVEMETGTAVLADGGRNGRSDGVDVVAHNHLVIGPLATVSALPVGTINLSFRNLDDLTIALDAVLQPQTNPVPDPSLPACPACGNGLVEPLEDCDGSGTCPLASDVCLPPGSSAECTCRDTCGTVPGVQEGEECDGGVGDQSCVSLGFAGGTLACTPSCTLDTTGCLAAVCGNGHVEPGEQCDGDDLDGQTCASLGHSAGGALTCTPDCAAIVTGPHCASDPAIACTADGDCADVGPCVAGCVQCGNGFVDTGEECDDGAANGSDPNHCRIDCLLPHCGDGIVDVSHCGGDADSVCTTAADCAPTDTCVPGERCDSGQAVCLGENKGQPCCRASDCPDGQCSGDDCTQNRDDVPGCCPCDCMRAAGECGDCDDRNPCTDDACDPGVGCTHVPRSNGASCGTSDLCHGPPTCLDGECRTGAPNSCDDGNPCTADGCDAASGCTHAAVPNGTPCGAADACHARPTCEAGACGTGTPIDCADGDVCTVDTCVLPGGCRHAPVDYAAAGSAVEASLFVPACANDAVPRVIGALLRRAETLMHRAGEAPRVARAKRLTVRARGRLALAYRMARHAAKHRLSGECGNVLAAVIQDALLRTDCLVHAS